MNLRATKKCEEQGLSADGSEKRRILGERIVKGIRFPVMTQHEFAAVVLDCKILTTDEAFSVVKYFSSVPDTPVGFSEKKRIGSRGSFQRCCRFGCVVTLIQVILIYLIKKTVLVLRSTKTSPYLD